MNKKVDISLAYPFLYKWKHENDVSILTNFYEQAAIDEWQSLPPKGFTNSIKQLKGSFAIIKNSDGFLLAAVDRIRSFPLFYKTDEKTITVTDHLPVNDNDEINLNPATFSYFIENSCTEGSETLLKDWKQLQPGEYLFFDKRSGEMFTNRYYRFEPLDPVQHLDFGKMKKTYLQTVSGILERIGNRPIIVMLSGGYDSRSIVSALKELNAKNVHTFTYGVKNSFEVGIAQKVATTLRFHWQFIEYSDELLKKFFEEEWQDLSSKNHNYSSLPGEQDFFALSYLYHHHLLPENGVVLSGFLGDCLGGSMFKNDFITTDKLAYQDDHMKNFACKYIVNTVRSYEYFGLEWYQVLMSPPILEAWFHIPLKQRCFENGYNDFLMETFFKPLGIDFEKVDHYWKPQYLKNYLKKYLPKPVVNFIRKRNAMKATDINNAGFITDQITLQSGKPALYKDINKIYAEFFLNHLVERAGK